MFSNKVAFRVGYCSDRVNCMNNFVQYTRCLLERPCFPLDSSKMNVRDVFGLLQYSRELVPVSEAICYVQRNKLL